jgi:hypothetical protein
MWVEPLVRGAANGSFEQYGSTYRPVIIGMSRAVDGALSLPMISSGQQAILK